MASPSASSHGDDNTSEAPLPRGVACLVCRRRKIRCDGARPNCGTCIRTGVQNCEYHDTQFLNTIILLEGQVTTLQSRLEGIHDQRTSTSSPSGDSQSASSPASSGVSPTDTAPSPQALDAILAIFTKHIVQLGMPSATTENSLRGGPPVLLEAACAIACHFAPQNLAFLNSFAPGFRMRAERALSGPSPATANPGVTLALIQSHSLLATLALMKGNMVDGMRHAGAAWQLAVSMRLHILEGSNVSPEQVETWWMVYRLDRGWSVALDMTPASPADDGIRTMFLPRDVTLPPPSHLQNLPSTTATAFDAQRESVDSSLTKVVAIYAAYHQILTGDAPALAAMAARLEQFMHFITFSPNYHVSAAVIALATLFYIRVAQNDNIRAATAAHSLAEVLGAILESDYNVLQPIVAICVQKVIAISQSTPGVASALMPPPRAMLGLALQRLSRWFPYVTALH
ncbi:hypothetical protein BKA62DRAFT_434672 [Auriculariales sp. MPI-PUGE-AT-0066]|nr:hypothetical protein BKA62DRAFT_434672 [Auriculariales sp. MPI-PUGE-AT-0066]